MAVCKPFSKGMIFFLFHAVAQPRCFQLDGRGFGIRSLKIFRKWSVTEKED